MQEHDGFQQFVCMRDVFRLAINMGDFGAETLKPSWLYSNVPWIADLLYFRMQYFALDGVQGKTVVDVVVRNGKKQVTGGTDLKQTQAYPKGFGRAVAKLIKFRQLDAQRAANQHRNRAARMQLPSLLDDVDALGAGARLVHDAELQPLFDLFA